MLICLECANNHSGDVVRGIAILDEFAPLIKEFPSLVLAAKFQYRSPSILHPSLKSDLTERVRSTMLSVDDRLRLKEHAASLGFKTGCTPFDEESADLVKAHGYDFVKIASASLTDWPLLERIATLGMPAIASTGGASDDDVERAVQFFKRRVPSLQLMHCVAEYPTATENLRLDRIDWLKRFGVPVGLSTHEKPDLFMGVSLAVAKGAGLFEWHVSALPCNAYSLTVEDTRARLRRILLSLASCEAKPSSDTEQASLVGLRRGVYAKRDLQPGETLTPDNVVLMLPCVPGQLQANDLSKYATYRVAQFFAAGSPVMTPYMMDSPGAMRSDTRQKVQAMADKVLLVLKASGAVLPKPAKLNLSHHHGLANFERTGCGMIEVVNGDKYAKKLIVMLPGQSHPEHKHGQKTETFQVLYGDLMLNGHVGGTLTAGDRVTMLPGMLHGFSSSLGCVFEEISTALVPDDSCYARPVDVNRKTEIWVP